MIKLSINDSSSLPIHMQLKHSILMNILSGKLEAGGKMPSIRSLAKILKVNPNTVAKVYYNLEEEGILGGKVGSGFTIRGNKKKLDSRIEIMNYGRYFPEFEAFKDAHDRSLKRSNKILVAS